MVDEEDMGEEETEEQVEEEEETKKREIEEKNAEKLGIQELGKLREETLASNDMLARTKDALAHGIEPTISSAVFLHNEVIRHVDVLRAKVGRDWLDEQKCNAKFESEVAKWKKLSYSDTILSSVEQPSRGSREAWLEMFKGQDLMVNLLLIALETYYQEYYRLSFQNKEANQTTLSSQRRAFQEISHSWLSQGIYDEEQVKALEAAVVGIPVQERRKILKDFILWFKKEYKMRPTLKDITGNVFMGTGAAELMDTWEKEGGELKRIFFKNPKTGKLVVRWDIQETIEGEDEEKEVSP